MALSTITKQTCSKELHQKLGYDYNETFSPIIKPVTIRILLSLAITHK